MRCRPLSAAIPRLLVLGLAAVLLAPVGAQAQAGAGTIAYVEGGEVWIATPDGSQRRQVTDGGGPWRNPSISDNGVVVAQRGDAVVRMTAGGTVLSTSEPPQSGGGIDHVVVQPSGQHVAYTTTCPSADEDCFFDAFARIAYADGRVPEVRAEDQHAPPTWLRDQPDLALLVSYGSVYTFGVPGGEYVAGIEDTPEPEGFEHPAVTPDGRYLAVAGSYDDYDEEFNELQLELIRFFDLGAVTADSTLVPTSCRISYPSGEAPGQIAFGPDGRSLVIEVLSSATGAPVRVDLLDDVTPTSCAGATPEPFAAGATDPSWSPVDYGDLPTSGSTDPEAPAPAPLTGTLAYVHAEQLWLAAPDGSGTVQLTEGGSWGSPSIAADGTILATYGDEPGGVHTALVRIPPGGEPLLFAPDFQLAGGIISAEISPDGQYAAYSTAELCTADDGRIFVCDSVHIVWADGRSGASLGDAILDSGETWYPGTHTVITGDGATLSIGSEDSEAWFDSTTFNSGDPSVSADGRVVAFAGSVAVTLGNASGPPPAPASEFGSCEFSYDEAYSRPIHQAAISPDGRALAYTLHEEGEEPFEGDLWIVQGLHPADCSVLPDHEEGLLVPDARDPFWSPLSFQQLTGQPGGGGGPTDAEAIAFAIEVSQQRFGDAGARQAGRQAAHVVLARVDVFADALGGSVLTADAPLLFTGRDVLDPASAAEIDRVLGGSGTVYLLGADAALSSAVEQALVAAGYTPRRLAGPSRVETAIAVADEAARLHGPAGTVAIARADSPPENPTAAWADSISAGAWAAETGQPILLTQTTLAHPAVDAWLDGHAGSVVFLGGAAAIADPTAAALADPVVRAQGANRYATAAAIADQLWPSTAAGFAVGNGAQPEAWTYDLAGAGLAADRDQPMLLTEAARLPEETAAALGCPRPPVTIIGTAALITAEVQAQVTSC